MSQTSYRGKNGVLTDFAKLNGKHLCQVLFLIISCRPEANNFIKKESPTRVFFVEFCKIFRKQLFLGLGLEAKASICSIIKENILLYCRKFSALFTVVIN